MERAHRIFEDLWHSLTLAMAACRANARKGAVHRVRTGSRRMEALLRKLLEDHPEAKAFDDAASKALRHLKKIRRLAGPVRDRDVQARLVQNLRVKVRDPKETEAMLTYLTAEREASAKKLQDGIGKHAIALERATETLAKEFQNLSAHAATPLATSKQWVARALQAKNALSKSNLHEFRKQTKAARYVAEFGAAHKESQGMAASLHSLQDAIGRWHDWDLLGHEARKVVGKKSATAQACREKAERAFSRALTLAQRPEFTASAKTAPRSYPRRRR